MIHKDYITLAKYLYIKKTGNSKGKFQSYKPPLDV